MFAIYKRELRSYFTTAVGYVFLAIIVALSAVAFSLTTILQASNDVTTYFTVLLFILMVALPVLTMKLFSEERKMRTEQLLLTAPVSIAKIVTAKFFAAFTVFFGANLLCSLAYITLFMYSEPEGGIILGNIIAITLVGAAFIAAGITAIYKVERLPLAAATMIQLAVLYADYILIYLFNGWLENSAFAIGIFTGIFIVGFAVIWYIILLVNRHKVAEMNRKMQKS